MWLTNHLIFLTGETTGTVTSSLTMESGDNDLFSRPIYYIETAKPFNGDAAFYSKLGGGGGGTVKLEIAFYNSIGFMATYHELITGVADDGEIELFLNSRDFAIWKPHFGVKFKYTRLTGSGDIPITEGLYVPEEIG